jgi:hypothetical protein
MVIIPLMSIIILTIAMVITAMSIIIHYPLDHPSPAHHRTHRNLLNIQVMRLAGELFSNPGFSGQMATGASINVSPDQQAWRGPHPVYAI